MLTAITRFTVLVVLLLVSSAAHTQFSRYVIELTDKKGSPYSLASPASFLSPRAVERRIKQQIAIDSSDLPVSPVYIDSLRSVPNLIILSRSKWLNQVCIQISDTTALARVNAFSFVKKVSAAAARIQLEPAGISKNTEKVDPPPLRLAVTNAVDANTLNYGNSFNQVHMHNGEFLHNLGFTGEGVIIAVLDAGFSGYKTNPAFDSARLQNRILGEWDFVDNQQSVNEDDAHGAFCFSILAANRPGLMVGSVPKAKFYLFRTEDASSEYPVEEQNWTAGAELADSLGVDMISSSLGYSDFDNHAFDHSYPQRNGITSIVSRAAGLAAKKGIIVMNSAGNSGNETSDLKFVECPADGDSVMAVGAVDIGRVIAGFSSWGPNGAGRRKPNIVSLGQGTTIAGLDGNPSSGNGTSFSNPNIAGLIACFWQAFPEFTNMQIIDAVQKSADRFNTPDNRYGYGIPDFKKGFAILLAKSFSGSMINTGCNTTLNWTGKDSRGMRYEIERRVGADTGFTRLASYRSVSDAFARNSYTFTDTLKTMIPVPVRYRIREVLADTAVVLLDSTVTINEPCLPGNAFIVSPTPFTTSIRLSITSPVAIEELGIALYNMQGQRLYFAQTSKPNGAFTYSIPAEHLPRGGYVVVITDKNSRIFSQAIVK